jgi:hypothetical protein
MNARRLRKLTQFQPLQTAFPAGAVDSSSTDDSRLRDALPGPDISQSCSITL